MAFSRSPRSIGAKFGFATAVALGSLPMISAEALAVPCNQSDSLQVGTNTAEILCEGTEGPTHTISESAVFAQSSQSITGTEVIVLTEPGSTAISDIVTATINFLEGNGYQLTVTLESDDETPLTSTFDQSIAETGAVQDLTADFTGLFDLNNNLPTILVSSDLDVPEPGSLAILAAGLAGFGLFRRRRQKTG